MQVNIIDMADLKKKESEIVKLRDDMEERQKKIDELEKNLNNLN